MEKEYLRDGDGIFALERKVEEIDEAPHQKREIDAETKDKLNKEKAQAKINDWKQRVKAAGVTFDDGNDVKLIYWAIDQAKKDLERDAQEITNPIRKAQEEQDRLKAEGARKQENDKKKRQLEAEIDRLTVERNRAEGEIPVPLPGEKLDPSSTEAYKKWNVLRGKLEVEQKKLTELSISKGGK